MGQRPIGFYPAQGEGWALRLDAHGRVRVDFEGPTTTPALRQCLDELDERMFDDAVIIVDLLRLEGHNPDSRELWKKWLSRNKQRVRRVVVVLPKVASILKMIAAAVGLASGIRLQVTDEVPDPTSR